MQASVIIPLYKDLKGLELILKALNNQSALGRFEVIVAEDDNATATIDFLKGMCLSLNFPIKHISHEDKGFRKCKALNDAATIADSDYLIFIDGDCIPHRHFVKQYLKEKEENRILYGRRVNLDEKTTNRLKQSGDLSILNFRQLLFTESSRVKEAIYLPFMPDALKSKRQFWGCNWAILKKHFLYINGYDEDYILYGFEDLDIYSRMDKAGFTLKSVKFQCIVYHLYHASRADGEIVSKMKKLYEEKMKQGKYRCINGIEKPYNN